MNTLGNNVAPKTSVLRSDDHLNKAKSEKTHYRVYSAKRSCNATERPMERVTVSLGRRMKILADGAAEAEINTSLSKSSLLLYHMRNKRRDRENIVYKSNI